MGKRSRKRQRESDSPQVTTRTHMRVIMPFTERVQEVTDALDATGYAYDAIDVSATDTSYFKLVRELWVMGDGWINVEHDIIPRATTFKEFEECPHAWCAAPYPYVVTGLYAGLGCSKITKQVIKRHPNIMDRVWAITDDTHLIHGHWCRLDGWLRALLEQEGETMHLHLPPIEHLGDNYPSHGCVKPPEQQEQ